MSDAVAHGWERIEIYEAVNYLAPDLLLEWAASLGASSFAVSRYDTIGASTNACSSWPVARR